MGQTAEQPDTTRVFQELLEHAARAHGIHEKEIGKPDPDWPPWYAQHMARELSESGYRITRESSE